MKDLRSKWFRYVGLGVARLSYVNLLSFFSIGNVECNRHTSRQSLESTLGNAHKFVAQVFHLPVLYPGVELDSNPGALEGVDHAVLRLRSLLHLHLLTRERHALGKVLVFSAVIIEVTYGSMHAAPPADR